MTASLDPSPRVPRADLRMQILLVLGVSLGASAVYSVTDPPMNLLRRVVPPLRLGGIALDLGFLILVFVLSIVRSVLGRMLIGA